MDIDEGKKKASTPRKPKMPSREQKKKTLAGNLARSAFNTAFPRLSSFLKTMREEKKVKKVKEPKNQTTVVSSPLRGQNQDQSGYSTKNDVADYTISDETMYEGVVPALSAGGKQNTQKAPKGTLARNAPASARTLQTASNMRVQSKETTASKDKETKQTDMQKDIQQRQQASKQRVNAAKQAEKKPMSMTKEEIEHINEMFVKNIESGHIQLDEKKWIGKAIHKPGALHKELGVPEGEKIPAKKLEKAAHEGGKTGQRARLAMTLKKMHKEEADLIEAEGKKGRPSTEDEHPIMQARKVISTRGQHKFTHKSGEKYMMDPKVAHKILAHHDNLKTASEKQEFADRVHHSKKSMEDALAGKPVEKQPRVSLAGKITGTQK